MTKPTDGERRRWPPRRAAPAGWPQPMRSAALHGPIGDLASAIAPHTEADMATLVLGSLVAVGNLIGRGPHFYVGATRHGSNLFAVIVGETARARKGTSWDFTASALRGIDPFWERERVQGGLSSGEGLIASVAGDLNSSPAPDKRILFLEDEFASVLRVMTRYGNTLSTTIRRAWDGRSLQVLTRQSPLLVTNAHVSLVGHVTEHDLFRYLRYTDVFSGFANRILWACARRSKYLPSGGTLPLALLRRITNQLRCAVEFAKKAREVGMSNKSQRLWAREYPALTADVPGLVGAATSRAEAQVRRLAAVYALMDQCDRVKLQHLRAGLAVWKYCEESARYIFGRNHVPSVEDKIKNILPTAGQGMSRSQISAAFSHHLDAGEISVALSKLQSAGTAKSKRAMTGGRSAEHWLRTV